jgi:protein-disulfide isomerase
VLGWAIFRFTDYFSPPKPVGLKLIRPVDPDRDHVRGDPQAPLTLVEYGDFECPFCSSATGSIDDVRHQLGDDLRYVWRHLPLQRPHPHAFGAAWASEAAAKQGKFWEMARAMFDQQDALEWPDIYRLANNLGLDLEKFNDDIHSGHVRHRVEDDALDAELMDLNSTPTFFVNGKRHKGPFDAASLIRALKS